MGVGVGGIGVGLGSGVSVGGATVGASVDVAVVSGVEIIPLEQPAIKLEICKTNKIFATVLVVPGMDVLPLKCM